jgi:hypothetical protein
VKNILRTTADLKQGCVSFWQRCVANPQRFPQRRLLRNITPALRMQEAEHLAA